MTKLPLSGSPFRLAELMAALSIATDLGMGQPLEQALSTCIVSVRLGEALGLSEAELGEVYYLSLLRYIGCNAQTYELSQLVGDELVMRQGFSTVDFGKPSQILGFMVQHMGRMNKGHPFQFARMTMRAFYSVGPVMREGAESHCEVGQRLAERLGFEAAFQKALGQAYERWDGKGVPAGLKGEAILTSVRLVSLVQDAVTFYRLDGVEGALEVIRERSGKAYDPALVKLFCGKAADFLGEMETALTWETVLSLEPGPPLTLNEAQLDRALRALADFSDLKSPYTFNHSSQLAELVGRAGRELGFDETTLTRLRRAAWVHDIGRAGVSAAIWNKPGPLTEKEWEAVRLHPYYSERVLAHAVNLAPLVELASLHHERLDGKGYYRRLGGSQLDLEARLLATADAFQAMTEARPYRSALSLEAAAAELKGQVKAGKIDPECCRVVLAATGQPEVTRSRRDWPGGLSAREVEVLILLARSFSVKEIAARLVISPKTVEHHIQHIYTKLDVSTRAGAALFAMQHDLLGRTLSPSEG
jgi:HD-GYP domain-containing protein (c-di-GMP phosphodiesterase class II)/DNA-binding CsgD family transcriptional regulator